MTQQIAFLVIFSKKLFFGRAFYVILIGFLRKNENKKNYSQMGSLWNASSSSRPSLENNRILKLNSHHCFRHLLPSQNLLSLAILAFAVAHFVINRKPQRKITTEISELGITINKKFYPFSVIKKFWIICEPPHVNTLHLHIKGQLLGEIKLELENQNPETVRRALTGKVVELPNQHESVSEILLRILKI